MKKVMYSSLAVCLVAAISVGVIFAGSGCTITEDQAKVIANQAGKYATLGWIMIENPTLEVKTAVKNIVVIIKDSAESVSVDKTYTEVLLPIIIKDVISEIPAKLQTICMAGTITILGGLDVMFAYHPDWKQDSQKAIALVGEFCDGVSEALTLDESSPVYQAAMKSAMIRSKLNSNKKEFIASFQK